MKIPTQPGCMKKKKPLFGNLPKLGKMTPGEAKRLTAQKRLEEIGFVKVTARVIANVLRAMAVHDTPAQRSAKLKLFSEIANEE